MSFFRVIIPSYNSEEYIEKAIQSVLCQSFTDYDLVVVDDCSDDNTPVILDNYQNQAYVLKITNPKSKAYSGGARNLAQFLMRDEAGEYTLFLDADDQFVDGQVFQDIYDLIQEYNHPDMVRLPYIRHNPNGTFKDHTPNILHEKTIEDVTKSPRVACWTKAVKSSLLQSFPENTLCEDVCQHLKQCDVTETVAWLDRPVVHWYVRKDSSSQGGSDKWKSSCYRFVADLMDLELQKEYTNARRKVKLGEAIENLRNGRYLQ